MRRTALALATALCGVAFAGPALADVTVKATVEKFKDVTVDEVINVTNTVTLFVLLGEQTAEGFSSQDFSGAAEALAVVNQSNTGNLFGGDGDVSRETSVFDLTEVDVKRRSLIYDSINHNKGIIGVNQDSGGNNNQGNVVAAAFTDLPDHFTHAESGGEQINHGNFGSESQAFPLDPSFIDLAATPAFVNPEFLGDNVWDALSSIEFSVNFNLGIVGVNQSSGGNNNQVTEVSAAIGSGAVALSEGALGQENSGNTVLARNTFRKDEMFGSVRANNGIIAVNQTAGFNNNQAAVVSVAAVQASTTIASGFVGGNPNPIIP